ncbi:MAG: protein kinase [Polyangiaceae bacterium]
MNQAALASNDVEADVSLANGGARDAVDGEPSGCVSARIPAAGSREGPSRGSTEASREGALVGRKYRVGKLLGAGAMGHVFAADHVLLGRKVAIKFLTPEALGHPDSIARLLREARATVALKSEHVVRVLDVDLLDGGAPYIVMEYLEGCDLAAWLRARGRPEVEVAVDFILQACDAIAEAHELRIVHRDVKPANLFAVQRFDTVETIKVLDFGISKTAGLLSVPAADEWRSGAIITEGRICIGSPCYMSPEQMESARDVDHRTDIWALGVTLCELVTGHLPFDGQSLVLLYSTIKFGAPLRLRERSPHLSPGLEAVILRCLTPDRDRRYPSVAELAMDLAPFGSSQAGKYLQTIARPLQVEGDAHSGRLLGNMTHLPAVEGIGHASQLVEGAIGLTQVESRPAERITRRPEAGGANRVSQSLERARPIESERAGTASKPIEKAARHSQGDGARRAGDPLDSDERQVRVEGVGQAGVPLERAAPASETDGARGVFSSEALEGEPKAGASDRNSPTPRPHTVDVWHPNTVDVWQPSEKPVLAVAGKDRRGRAMRRTARVLGLSAFFCAAVGILGAFSISRFYPAAMLPKFAGMGSLDGTAGSGDARPPAGSTERPAPSRASSGFHDAPSTFGPAEGEAGSRPSDTIGPSADAARTGSVPDASPALGEEGRGPPDAARPPASDTRATSNHPAPAASTAALRASDGIEPTGSAR